MFDYWTLFFLYIITCAIGVVLANIIMWFMEPIKRAIIRAVTNESEEGKSETSAGMIRLDNLV